MTNHDSYFNKLSEIAAGIESVYGLDKANQLEVSYSKLDIETVLSYSAQRSASLAAAQRNEQNAAAGRETVLLSYITVRLEFYGKYVLSYENYPYLGETAEILLNFLRKETITQARLRDLNRIIEILAELDKKYVSYRFSLSYRYLRLFIIMIVYENYWNASVVARLLLMQMQTKED